eukprot:365249-Chlamydomonas_euryale.AAC.2
MLQRTRQQLARGGDCAARVAPAEVATVPLDAAAVSAARRPQARKGHALSLPFYAALRSTRTACQLRVDCRKGHLWPGDGHSIIRLWPGDGHNIIRLWPGDGHSIIRSVM